MTERELWLAIMNYEDYDRMPVFHWEQWDETLKRWHQEGLPEDQTVHEYFGVQPLGFWIKPNLSLFPKFPEIVLEDHQDYQIVRNEEGVVQKRWKDQTSIPQDLDYSFKSARDWDAFQQRLQPDPRRLPANLEQLGREAAESGNFIVMHTASLVGEFRNWMGLLNLTYLTFDEPDLFGEMVNTMADLTCWAIDEIVPHLPVKPCLGWSWEDICGKNGPLIDPKVFEKYVVPGYQKIRAKLEEHGIHFLAVDSDGEVSSLVPLWLEGGVNIQFPVEVGTWQADAADYRRRYGHELRIIGNFNKAVLEAGPDAIDREIEKKMPLMAEGGYILLPDHAIPPGVSLENYRYYIEKVRSLRF